MPQIKFSHKYSKLLDSHGDIISYAILLQVVPYYVQDLSPIFKKYDTDNGLFKLPRSGKFLILIFQKPDLDNIFTTIRRYTPEKADYYCKLVGKTFDVIINKENNHAS